MICCGCGVGVGARQHFTVSLLWTKVKRTLVHLCSELQTANCYSGGVGVAATPPSPTAAICSSKKVCFWTEKTGKNELNWPPYWFNLINQIKERKKTIEDATNERQLRFGDAGGAGIGLFPLSVFTFQWRQNAGKRTTTTFFKATICLFSSFTHCCGQQTSWMAELWGFLPSFSSFPLSSVSRMTGVITFHFDPTWSPGQTRQDRTRRDKRAL